MTGLAATRLIAIREITERIGSRVLRITTVVMAVLVVAGVVIPSVVHGSAAPTRIGLVGAPAQELAPALRTTATLAKLTVRVTDVASAGLAREEVRRGSLDVAVSLTRQGATAVVAQSLSPTAQALLAAIIDAVHQRGVLSQAGVAPATIRSAQARVPLRTEAIAPPPSHTAARYTAAVVAGILLYVILAMYGNAVATGVAQEKTTRTAEVLIAAVRPRQLLAGKVIGIGLCGLAQLAVVVVAGLIANGLVHSAQIPSTMWLLLPSILLWFALGYALYAFAFAAAGALVARQEELQFVTAPLTMPLLAGYLLVYAAIASPHSIWIAIASFLPPLAPALMPARIALGGVPWWEIPLDALIMLVSIYMMVRVATRIYIGALVRGGARLSWRAALRLDAPQRSSP
ncbi:MAG: ABC transporter permease [Solirubrobacteraceae bacterium]|jgi:ABC-2 type transport system permease protein